MQKTLNYPLERIYAEITGPEDAPPMVLLHGWGSSAHLMRPIAEAFQTDYRVYALDFPGHGHSPPPPEPWGVPEFAHLLEMFLQHHHLTENVTLIGHSNGGRIALFLASCSPLRESIRRMVLISPSGIRPTRRPSYYVKTAIARTLKAPFQGLPTPLREKGLHWLRGTFIWDWLASSDYQQTEGVMRETFVRTVNFYLTPEHLRQINIPVLLFWGTQDKAITYEQMKKLEEALPDAGLVLLENAGHYAYLDNPHQFLQATRYFLNHS